MRCQTHPGGHNGKNHQESLEQQSAINQHASVLSETIAQDRFRKL
jgi:hypothetical protein